MCWISASDGEFHGAAQDPRLTRGSNRKSRFAFYTQAPLRTATNILIGVVLASAVFVLGPLVAAEYDRSRAATAPQSAQYPTLTKPSPPQIQIQGRRYYSETRRGEFLEFRGDGTVFISLGGSPADFAIDGPNVIIS